MAVNCKSSQAMVAGGDMIANVYDCSASINIIELVGILVIVILMIIAVIKVILKEARVAVNCKNCKHWKDGCTASIPVDPTGDMYRIPVVPTENCKYYAPKFWVLVKSLFIRG